MNHIVKVSLGGLLILGMTAGGYWLGTQSRMQNSGLKNDERGLNSVAKIERKLLYYRNPMGLPDTSAVPKKDAMGMA
ncbi:MAG: efflux RND transporter periplasmic adaptor subunit, partial [Gallionella sp.]